MASHPVKKEFPPCMVWADKVRPAKAPDWQIGAAVARRAQFALQYQRKSVFTHTRSPLVHAPPIAGPKIPWRWKCHTGENTESGDTLSIVANVLVDPPGSMTTAGAGDPRWRLNVGGTFSDYVRAPLAPDTANNNTTLQTAAVTGLAANTEYDCYIESEGFLRVLSASVFEVPTFAGGVDLDHTTAVMDHRPYGASREITNVQAQQLYRVPYLLWRHSHAHSVNIVADDDLGFRWERVTDAYVNMLDTSASTTVSANTAGVNVQFQYHPPDHKDTLTCVFAVYASNTDGFGGAGTGTGGNVKLVGTGGDISGSELGAFATTGGWQKATVEIDGSSDGTKLDVHFKGDATNDLWVEAVSLYPITT